LLADQLHSFIEGSTSNAGAYRRCGSSLFRLAEAHCALALRLAQRDSQRGTEPGKMQLLTLEKRKSYPPGSS